MIEIWIFLSVAKRPKNTKINRDQEEKRSLYFVILSRKVMQGSLWLEFMSLDINSSLASA